MSLDVLTVYWLSTLLSVSGMLEELDDRVQLDVVLLLHRMLSILCLLDP